MIESRCDMVGEVFEEHALYPEEEMKQSIYIYIYIYRERERERWG